MKLHPDGTVEGTPKECAEFKRIQHEETHSKPFKEHSYTSVDWGSPVGDHTAVPILKASAPKVGYITVMLSSRRRK